MAKKKLKSKKVNCIIFGGTGLIGSYLRGGIKLGGRDADIKSLQVVEKILKKYQPKLVIHLAAKTGLGKCEQDPADCYAVNVVGTYNIAAMCGKYGARLVYVSTGAVFNGKKSAGYSETDAPNPLNVYGRSKYAGELIAADMPDDSLVVRTGWVFGGGRRRDNKFYGQAVRKLLAGEIVEANFNETGSPVYAKDLAKALEKLANSKKTGVIHLVNSGRASRYDIAGELAKILKVKPLIKKTHSRDFKEAFARALCEVLKSNYLKLRPWQDALKEYVKTEWN